MGFKKAVLKKQLDIEDDEPIEFIDLKMQYEISPGESYENILACLTQRLEVRFKQMFRTELSNIPILQAEREKWVQRGLFEERLN